MPSLHVPLEICSIICTQVDDPSTLAALCRTSRSFRDEAQRILYHTIDLGGHPIRHVKSWARAITRNAHLAGRVHALSLQLPQARKLAESDSEDVSKIQRALHSCINLKELKFTGVNLEALRRPKHAYVWILDDAPFWLTKFDNSYFATGALKRFWPAQSDIRVLSLPHSIDAPTVFADGQLPNLIALRVPQWPVLPQGRPLQRLETGFTNDFSPLAHYSGTLTTLNLVCEWYYPGLLGPITNIPTLLPALLHFGIAECVKLLPHVPLMECFPAATLARFLSLETFFLILRTVVRIYNNPTPDPIYHLDSEKDVEDFASLIMVACPTLRRVVVGAEAQMGRELTCTLTRTLGGSIHTNRGTEIDFEAASMFWKL